MHPMWRDDDVPETGARESGRFRMDLDKVWNDLYHGNGRPGLCTRVLLTEEAVDRINETLEKFNKLQEKVIWLLLSVLIAAVLNLIIKR